MWLQRAGSSSAESAVGSATEMRQRIRSGIVAKLQSQGEEHAYWQEQLTNLDKAQIGTIHSLCNSILKNNPVESNLDPAFVVAEERDADVFLETQTKNFVRQQLRAQNPEVLQLTGEYGSVRFLNQDIIDLYARVPTGTRVVVLPSSGPGALG